MAGGMYFIHDNSIKSFYGKGGIWMPYATAKAQMTKLCIFACVEDARSCMIQNGLINKVGVAVFNEKSTRSKLKLKKISQSLKPNWMTSENITISNVNNSTSEQGKAQNHCEKGNHGARPTYCAYLDTMPYNSESGMVIHSENAKALMTTELIQKTLSFVSEASAMMDEWNKRMEGVDEEIRYCDLRTADELHRLEFEDMSEQSLMECAKRLQDIRKVRRIAKNEKAVGELLNTSLGINDVSRKLQDVQDYILHGQNERLYKVRVPEAYITDSSKNV